MIKRIKVTNFKSFENLDIELGRFNILIGANASGKSNFVSIFRFLRDIATTGLDNAISIQGGIEYLRNMYIGASQNLSIRIDIQQAPGFTYKLRKNLIGMRIYEISYEFSLRFNKRGSGFRVERDELIQKGEIIKLEKKEILGKGEIIITHNNGKVKVINEMPEEWILKKEEIFPLFLLEGKLHNRMLLLEIPYFLMPFLMEDIFYNISIYDFDPKLSKKAYPITGKADLEENGENLSIVLKNILQNKEKKRKLFNLIKELLPFVENLDVEKFADKSLLFKLRETYFKNQYLPASLISDGTINITTLIIALFFEKSPLIIVEEPERNIHPYLISKIIDMMKDASQKKQIIVTTHNPEVVKCAEIEDILLVSSNEKGFSIISKPGEKAEVKTFLKNEIGIEELYIQNLL